MDSTDDLVNFSVQGNLIHGADNLIDDMGGIWLQLNATIKNLTLSSNQVWGCGPGYSIDCTGGTAKNLAIHGNVVRDTGLTEVYIDGGSLNGFGMAALASTTA
jgi:hypothetical protein